MPRTLKPTVIPVFDQVLGRDVRPDPGDLGPLERGRAQARLEQTPARGAPGGTMISIHARGTVAVGIDDSPEAVTAARYAVSLAQSRNVDLLVVCAYGIPMASDEMTSAMKAGARASAEQLAVDVVSQLTLPPTMRVGTVVELDTPAALLCRIAETAAAVVLGVHHFDLSDQLITGEVASEVAAKANCPVVVVPRHWGREWKGTARIVVAVDGETATKAVLDFAFGEAERSQSTVTALHSVTRPDEQPGLSQRSSIAEILAGHEQGHPDIAVRTLVLPGLPAPVIIYESSAASLMVVGRPHRERLGSWTHSVAKAVLEQTHCPLVIVPGHPSAEEPQSERLFATMAPTGNRAA